MSKVSIDLSMIYRILNILADMKPRSLLEIEREGKFSRVSVIRYTQVMEYMGLVRIHGLRPKKVIITDKGLRIYSELTRILAQLGLLEE